GTEQRAGDDAERQTRHLLGNVDHPACGRLLLPLIDHRSGHSRHHLGHRRDATAMERRLDELALATPQLAIAEYQPLAGDSLELPEDHPFPVVAMIVVQDVLDIARSSEHEGAERREADAYPIAIAALGVQQEAERVAPHHGEEAEGGEKARTRRLARSRRS